MLHVTKPMAKWYNEWCSSGRSCEEGVRFYVGMAVGSAVLPSIHSIFAPFADMQQLQNIGFVLDELDIKKLQASTIDAGPVLHEDLGLPKSHTHTQNQLKTTASTPSSLAGQAELF